VAVDARGDAAVAWATQGNPEFGPNFHSSVHVTVRTASGRLSTRTVWSSHDAETEGLSVVIGAGEATVAWDARSRAEAQGRTIVIRAAYGPLIGRWRPARAIRRIPFEPPGEVLGGEPAEQHLAIAPDGEVLLAFNASGEAAGLAWRAPGHAFGVPQLLSEAPDCAIPQFDAHGAAYLSGSCNGFVRVAPAHSHRFRRTAVLTNSQVFIFTLALSGAGRGIAAWVTGECDGHTPGPVFASVLKGGKFGTPLALTPSATQAVDANAVAAPGGDTVTWYAGVGGGQPSAWPQAYSLQIGANGVPGATQTLPIGAPIALVSDAGGDVVFGLTLGTGTPHGPGLFVRPAGGGADQPAPSLGQVAGATPVGRAVAVAWNTSPTRQRTDDGAVGMASVTPSRSVRRGHGRGRSPSPGNHDWYAATIDPQ